MKKNETEAFLLSEKKEDFELEVKGLGAKVIPFFVNDIITLNRGNSCLVKNPFLRFLKMVLLRFATKVFKIPMAIISRASRHKMTIEHWDEGKSLILKFTK